MNKHRKAESRRVRSYVRWLRGCGRDISYKKARRRIRKLDRAKRDLPKKLASSLVRTSMLPLRATALVIDEMAFYDETRPQWPKENPYLNKEETNDAYV